MPIRFRQTHPSLRPASVALIAALTVGGATAVAAQEKPAEFNIGITTYSSGSASVFGVPARQAAEMLADAAEPERLLSIDDALCRLGEFNPRLAQLVECRYFAGMTEAETAEAMQSSLRTVQRDWMRARAWLLKFLEAS